MPGLLLVAILFYALPKEPLNLKILKEGDWLGVATMAVGLASLEVVLEEGNRKDWFGSAMITQLAVVACISLTVFLIHEWKTKLPLINLRLLARRNFGIGSIANVTLGLGLYGSIYLVPVYLAQIQNYSSLQVGQVLIWMGLPQLFIIPFIPKIAQKVDGRYMVAFGMAMFATSCLLNSNMTSDYAGPQMMLSMFVRALGQPFIFIPLSSLATAGIEKAEAGSASALFNMMRNLGGSIGIAIISTFLTHREQFHSSRIGESISLIAPQTQERIQAFTQLFLSKGFDAVTAHQQALAAIDRIVRQQAFIMAYNDAFLLIGLALLCCMVTPFLMRPTGGPQESGAH